ncbi:MAG TPA: hypothetical protein VKU00_19625 [Chthonomonadaceae bacterium]|nr:hypothetical protein [Chthonomonadaceae bacterium]
MTSLQPGMHCPPAGQLAVGALLAAPSPDGAFTACLRSFFNAVM